MTTLERLRATTADAVHIIEARIADLRIRASHCGNEVDDIERPVEMIRDVLHDIDLAETR